MPLTFVSALDRGPLNVPRDGLLLRARVRAEFHDMPGFSLPLPQAARCSASSRRSASACWLRSSRPEIWPPTALPSRCRAPNADRPDRVGVDQTIWRPVERRPRGEFAAQARRCARDTQPGCDDDPAKKKLAVPRKIPHHYAGRHRDSGGRAVHRTPRHPGARQSGQPGPPQQPAENVRNVSCRPFVNFQDSAHCKLLRAGDSEVPTWHDLPWRSRRRSAVASSVGEPLLAVPRAGKIAPHPEFAANGRLALDGLRDARKQLRDARRAIGRVKDAARRQAWEEDARQAEVPIIEATQASHAFVYDRLEDRLKTARAGSLRSASPWPILSRGVSEPTHRVPH